MAELDSTEGKCRRRRVGSAKRSLPGVTWGCLSHTVSPNAPPIVWVTRGLQVHWRGSISRLESLTGKQEFTTFRALGPDWTPGPTGARVQGAGGGVGWGGVRVLSRVVTPGGFCGLRCGSSRQGGAK